MFEASAFDVEMVIAKTKRHISPGIDQIAKKLIKAEGAIFRSEIHTQNSI